MQPSTVQHAQQGTQSLASFLPIMILGLLLVLLNIIIAPRKGKSRIIYGLIAVIPLFGFLSTLYLVSFPEKTIVDKLDKIIELLQSDGR